MTPAKPRKRRDNPAELLVMGANPGELLVMAANPSAPDIYERFSGTPSEWFIKKSEPHMPRGDYAQLGKLLNLYVKPATGGPVLDIHGWSGKPPVIVSDVACRHIYFFGGDQDLSTSLRSFGAVSRGDDIYELGTCVRIDYQARKEHVAKPSEDRWKHHFGEENGQKPKLLFDAKFKRLLLEGGDYRIDGAWIRN